MKFIHKISKIISYIIQICLLIFVLASNSLWGEVIALEGKRMDTAAFKNFVKANPGYEGEGSEKFEGLTNLQMPGYGVFIRTNELDGQVYIARKQHGHSTTLHDPTKKDREINPGHPFNIAPKDHTERQLVLHLAAEALNLGETTRTEINTVSRLLKEKLPINNNIIPSLPEVTGEFHIYTKGSPCVADIPDNNNFSCIKYYKILQQMFPNCKFHIYFTQPLIHTKLDQDHVQKLIEKIIKMVPNKKKDFGIYEAKESDYMMRPYKGRSVCGLRDGVTREEFIAKVNYMLDNTFTPKEIEDLFNEVFNITNFHYHMVTPISTNDSSIGRDTYNENYNKGIKRKSKWTDKPNKRQKTREK